MWGWYYLVDELKLSSNPASNDAGYSNDKLPENFIELWFMEKKCSVFTKESISKSAVGLKCQWNSDCETLWILSTTNEFYDCDRHKPMNNNAVHKQVFILKILNLSFSREKMKCVTFFYLQTVIVLVFIYSFLLTYVGVSQ